MCGEYASTHEAAVSLSLTYQPITVTVSKNSVAATRVGCAASGGRRHRDTFALGNVTFSGTQCGETWNGLEGTWNGP